MQLVLLGVPTSAGAHHAGQELAAAAVREHGLLAKLRSAGLDVTDGGDVAGEVFRADSFDAVTRNVDAVVRVALAVADAVESHARAGRIPIVIGGDCTISLGVVAGLQRVHDDVRLAYLDGDADLVPPGSGGSGILDATGVAHLIGTADTPLARIGRTVPMLADHQLFLLGYDPGDADSFRPELLAGHPGLGHVSGPDLLADPLTVARTARDALIADNAVVAVHFDVDAVDSRDLPLANYPHYGLGLPLDVAGAILTILLDTPALAALTLTEVNPTHDPGGAQLERYVDTVVAALVSSR